MDKQRNFIVTSALETRDETVTAADGTQSTHKRERTLGQVMIPGKHLVSVQAEAEALRVAQATAAAADTAVQ
jgi:hypothetical protein